MELFFFSWCFFLPSSFHFGNVFEMIAINCLFVLKFEIMESNQFIFFDFDINVFAMCGSGLWVYLWMDGEMYGCKIKLLTI